MTEQQLADLERLANAATPGPTEISNQPVGPDCKAHGSGYVRAKIGCVINDLAQMFVTVLREREAE